MSQIRIYEPQDKEQCIELCAQNEVMFCEPNMQDTLAFVTVENNKITSYAFLSSMTLIEPLVSKNKFATVKMINELKTMGSKYIGLVKQDDTTYLDLLKKQNNIRILHDYAVVLYGE